MNGTGLDAQTVDELERQGLMSPDVAEQYRQRQSPELGPAIEQQAQQWSSPAMPGLAPPEQSAGAAWGSTAQAVLGRKLQAPTVDTSGFRAPEPGSAPQPQRKAPVGLPSVGSSAGAMARNRKEYGQTMAANIEEQRQAGEKQLEGKLESERLGAQRAVEEQGYAKERIAQMEQDRAAAVERKQRFDDRMRQKQSELDAEMAAAREEKIDPDRRSMGNKIGAAIAIGLGTYAQIMGGGENTALKLVQQQIDNDIAVQREGMAARRQLLGEKRQGLAQERDQFATDEDWEHKLAARGYEMAKSKVDALLNEKYLDAGTRAKLEEIRGQFEAEQAQRLGAIMEREAATTNSMLANEDAARARAFGNQIELLKAGGGRELKQPLSGTADKIAELRASRRELEKMRGEFVEKTSAGSFITKRIPGSSSQKIDKQLENAKIRYRKAMTGSGFSASEAEAYDKLFPSADTIDESALNNLDAIIESLANQERTYIETQRQVGYDTRGLEQGGPDASSGFVPGG